MTQSWKIKIIKSAVNLPYTARMVGDYLTGINIHADIGAGNDNYVMCFRKGHTKDILFPISVTEDNIKKVTTKSPIVAIFRKDKDASLYDEMTYKSKNINIDKLHIPKDIKAMLIPEVYQMLKPEPEKAVAQEKADVQPKRPSLMEWKQRKKAIVQSREAERKEQSLSQTKSQKLKRDSL